MARRSGSSFIPLAAGNQILKRQRKDTWDKYVPIDAGELIVRDSLAPPENRFRFRFKADGGNHTCDLTRTALDQICYIAGIPACMVERIPASMFPRLYRVLLQTSVQDRSRMKLFRLRGTTSEPVLRAVLPHGRVRITDQEIYQTLSHVAGSEELRLARFSIDEDSMFIRAIFPSRMNAGTYEHMDDAFVGIDILSSETGVHNLQVRHCLFRLVCENGITREIRTSTLSVRGSRHDRACVEDALRRALQEGMSWGQQAVHRLADTRSQHLADPDAEMRRVFERFRIGGSEGKLAKWVRAELQRETTLLGARRFDVVQAFSAVARGLEHRDRMRLEDAMGEYMMSPVHQN